MKSPTILAIFIYLMIISGFTSEGSTIFRQDSTYTLASQARASSVFKSNAPELVLDKNLNTSWISDNPYPDQFYANPIQNILLNHPLKTTSGVSLKVGTDGLLVNYTPTIPLVNGEASVWYDFASPTSVFQVGIRLRGLSRQPVILTVCDQAGNCYQQSYLPSQNNSNVRFLFDKENIVRVSLSSTAPFAIYDMAVVAQPIEEFVILDFDGVHTIKQINTKHWAGSQSATASTLWLSEDGNKWVKIADLDPNQPTLQQTILETPQKAKHLKLSHRLVQENYKKISIFEIEVIGVVLKKEGAETPTNEETEVTPGTWDPHAGVYRPFSQGSLAFSSSELSSNHASKVIDNDFSSAWISNNPLPDRYVSNVSQNILLSKTAKASNGVNLTLATDGNLGNLTPSVQPVNGEAWVRLSLTPSTIYRFSMRLGGVVQDSVKVEFRSQGQLLKSIFYTKGSSGHQRFVVEQPLVDEIYLSSSSAFVIQELAAYRAPLEESVTLDLGEEKNIGWIRARYWNGDNANSAVLYAGKNLDQLEKIKDLDPRRLNFEDIVLNEPISARYVRLSQSLVDENFKKASVQELTVFDEAGSYGPKPAPKPQQHSFGDLFGINTVWAWGTNKNPDLQSQDEGAQKFIRAGSQARNYHNIHWDTSDPDLVPNYIPGIYQVLNEWTQWHREYTDWKKKGFSVDATYTFDRFEESAWNTPYESAFNLGSAFAQVYGPRNLNLIRSVEIGNEPWNYSDSTYVKILEGMAKGLKEADPDLTVLPAALQAADPGYNNIGISKNYMGNKLSAKGAQYLDGINVHLYSYAFGENGVRVAVHPEHPQSRMQEVYSSLRFRDKNMPGKQVHVTEWGWDASSINEIATNSEAVSHVSQAVYLVRGLMWLSRMGVDMAHWYFYSNVPIESGQPVNHDRSGLTESRLFNFKEKRSFTAAEAVKNLMSDLYFDHVIQENEEAYIYGLRNKKGEFSHLIAWRPVTGEDSIVSKKLLPINRSAPSAWYLSGLNPQGEAVEVITDAGMMILPLSSKPILVALGEAVSAPPSANSIILQSRILDKIQKEFKITTEYPLETLGEVLFRKGCNELAVNQLQNLNWLKEDELNWKAVTQELNPGDYVLKVDLPQHTLQSNLINLKVNSRFLIFPNPVKDVGSVVIVEPFPEEAVLTVIDIRGKIEVQIILPPMEESYQLNLSNLINGVYIVQVQSNKYISQIRVIKNDQ